MKDRKNGEQDFRFAIERMALSPEENERHSSVW